MIVLITGVMASGKSAAAQAVAERLERSIHLRGDIFRKMIVNGRRDMSSEPDSGAYEQLLLRYKAASDTAKTYSAEGFNVIYQDTIIGPVLSDVVELYQDELSSIVVLCPSAEVVASREELRAKTGYGRYSVAELQSVLEDTPRLGLWLDNSNLTVEATAKEIVHYISRTDR